MVSYKHIITVSLVALLVAAPFTSAQSSPPPRAPAPGTGQAQPPQPRAPPPSAPPPTTATPPVRAPAAAPPTTSATPPTRAPASAPTTSTPVLVTPSSAPRPSTINNLAGAGLAPASNIARVAPAFAPGPSASRLVSLAPAPGPSGTKVVSLVTLVPTNATTNTTNNVPASQAVTPPPANATVNVVTVQNTTVTTTITTQSFFSITLQVTVIYQFFFTVFIGQTMGTRIFINFNLQGNVANTLSVQITGGPSGTTTMVTGPTVAVNTVATETLVAASQTTTFQQTTIQTTQTTTTQQTTTTTGTGTTTTTTTPTVKQVCSVPNNPYGLLQNTANEGTLVKGAFLVSSWNTADTNNVAGQGNNIYQCLPNATANSPATIWSKVNITGACKANNAGGVVGVTMAFSRCGDIFIVGSLPIPNNDPRPGCLIALDTSGNVINEVTSPGINGPWGSVCSASGGQISFALSSVLGGTAPSTTAASGGRKLLQGIAELRTLAPAPAPAANGITNNAFVVRWTFPTPTKGLTWSLGTPTFLLKNIATGGAAGVAGGNVGPGGLAVDDQGNLYAPDLVGNQIWKIPNGLTTSSPNATVLAVTNATATGLFGPNAVDFSNGQPLLVANAGDGNLVQIPLNSARNGGAATVFQVTPAAGQNFKAIYSVDASAGAAVGSIWTQNDNNNTLNTVIGITG